MLTILMCLIIDFILINGGRRMSEHSASLFECHFGKVELILSFEVHLWGTWFVGSWIWHRVLPREQRLALHLQVTLTSRHG